MRGVMTLLALATLVAGVRAQESSLDTDEVVELFPTFGWRVDDGQAWEFDVHGWVYERGHRRELLNLFVRRVGLDDQLDDVGRATLAERAVPFLVDNERGETVVVEVGAQRFQLDRSAANGHFRGRVRVAAADAERLGPTTGPAPASRPASVTLTLRCVLPAGDPREFTGTIELVGERGRAVISDIDDTLKISEVTDKRALLRNTFLRPHKAVPGLADVFQAWRDSGDVTFHYVSASPWQLCGSLAAFFRRAGYPAGSFHLKTFRWKDESFFDLFQSPEEYKPPVMEELLTRFPLRQFVLVGDSGEKDPEVYAALARRYPGQIARIFIRDVAPPGENRRRLENVFADLPRGSWQVFRDAEELPRQLP